MTVLKICIGEWNNASRDQRELAVCRELGADVKVLAKGDRTDRGRIEMVNTFEVHRFTTRPVRRFPTAINRILSVFDWARYARKLRPAVISGHDIGGLLIGWLSVFFLFGKKRPRLVYDSHEFELGRNVDRSKAVTLCLGLLERFLIRRSVFTIVVNQSIAQELKRVHHMKTDPVVVRNIPDKWFVDDTVCASMKKKLLEMQQLLIQLLLII